jgi:YD repeat-containing protein
VLANRLCTVTDWAGRVVTYAYDTSGRLQRVTDRAGKATTYAYDGTTQHLTSITDANNHVAVAMTYDA